MRLSHSFSSIKMYENCPLRYYHQRIVKSVVDKGGEASQYGERIHKFLEDRLLGGELASEITHLEPTVDAILKLTGSGVLEVEKELTLNKELAPTGWWDKDAWMRSKLDVLILHKNSAVVMDWKTGKRRPDFSQLELFALQVFSHYPEIETVRSSFIWIQDKTMDKDVYKRSSAPDMWRKLVSRVNRIEQSLEKDVWPAKPSGLCKFCPCKNFCDFAPNT